MSRPSHVRCFGEGLTFGYMGRPIHAQIDTRAAGAGELTVYCSGPGDEQDTAAAFCELADQGGGVFQLTVTAQTAGQHALTVLYDDVHVPGSPFPLRVSAAGLVTVRGPGLKDGVIFGYDDRFIVDSSDAGPGEIRIRVGGPKGAFHLTQARSGRCLHCNYFPQRPGIYIMDIRWSGDPIPGSPFHVYLCATEFELQKHASLAARIVHQETVQSMLDDDDMDHNVLNSHDAHNRVDRSALITAVRGRHNSSQSSQHNAALANIGHNAHGHQDDRSQTADNLELVERAETQEVRANGPIGGNGVDNVEYYLNKSVDDVRL